MEPGAQVSNLVETTGRRENCTGKRGSYATYPADVKFKIAKCAAENGVVSSFAE